MDESHNLSSFYESGIHFFKNDPNAVFVDPVRVLNRCYNRFRVSPSTYYPRFFESLRTNEPVSTVTTSEGQKRQRKRKRNKEPPPLNEREQIANQRHQTYSHGSISGDVYGEVLVARAKTSGYLGFTISKLELTSRFAELRPLLLKAHESLLKCIELLDALRTLRNDSGCSNRECDSVQHSLIELGKEAPLLEVTLYLHLREPQQWLIECEDDFPSVQCCQQRVLHAFNNLVANDTKDDAVGEILNNHYILPQESCFYMSDLGQIRNLIPAHADSGFNLIMVDPPWENASAHQKSRYPTLPNRYFLSLPIKQLTHTDGALVALWVTNREKLRSFVERELLPAWGVSYAASFYWLKVKANGSLISDLDLFHHRPYESLILGYIPGKVNNYDNQSKFKPVKDDLVIMSIPGDYSRKPPIAELLLDYVPGPKPPRCIELFAREVMAGWVAWGNEPLHFQDSRNFVKR